MSAAHWYRVIASGYHAVVTFVPVTLMFPYEISLHQSRKSRLLDPVPPNIWSKYDGVYVDGTDKFEHWQRRRPSAAADMVSLIRDIASYARAQRKDFLLIPQNGDGLLGDSQFLETVDGFAREDLLYGETEPEVRNTPASISESVRRMRPLVAAGKPVLVIEYTSDPALAASMLREIKALGFIGYAASRELKMLSPPAFGCGQPDCSR